MTETRRWIRSHGRRHPWHLAGDLEGDTDCGSRIYVPIYNDFAGLPDGHCRACGARYRHQLRHPQPLQPVIYDDLNLTDQSDVAIYHKRVAEMFRLTQVNTIVQYVLDAGGPRPPARRDRAVTALADAWIRQPR